MTEEEKKQFNEDISTLLGTAANIDLRTGVKIFDVDLLCRVQQNLEKFCEEFNLNKIQNEDRGIIL